MSLVDKGGDDHNQQGGEGEAGLGGFALTQRGRRQRGEKGVEAMLARLRNEEVNLSKKGLLFVNSKKFTVTCCC